MSIALRGHFKNIKRAIKSLKEHLERTHRALESESYSQSLYVLHLLNKRFWLTLMCVSSSVWFKLV